MSDYQYVCQWSDSLEDQFVKDFISVQNQVLFKGSFTYAFFKKKYIDNPYGKSLLLVVYDGNKPIAAIADWRNDLGDRLAYQSADGNVIKEYRKKGVFTKTESVMNSYIEKDAVVYGFPNMKSYPAFVKMKWYLVSESRVNLFLFPYQMKDEKIPYDYAKWWILGHNNLYSIKWLGHYYLVRKRINKPVCRVLGEVDKQTASLFQTYKQFTFLTFSSRWKLLSLFDKNAIRIISLRHSDVFVPTWKVDAM